jgi:hypothetical protein
MGLLDDAIREHLEFKRQRGADANEVARQEHEALGPVDRGGDTATAVPASLSSTLEEPREGPRSAGLAPSSEDHQPVAEQDLSHVGEETAELDMRTVLKTEPPVRAAAPANEESLEWEMPGEAASGSPADSPAGPGDEEEEPVEDVLEETPDFLRETPDQDRLWFEQQPPRDFDFDK